MSDRASFQLPRRLLLAGVLLGAAGCMMQTPVDAPPRSIVFFTALSANLDDQANTVIDAVARDSVAHPARTVVVQGFADRVGTPTANKTLSELRAQVVADALVARGVNRQKIALRPRGATASDPGVESRRVDISFGS